MHGAWLQLQVYNPESTHAPKETEGKILATRHHSEKDFHDDPAYLIKDQPLGSGTPGSQVGLLPEGKCSHGNVHQILSRIYLAS